MILCWWFVSFPWFIVRLNITTQETLKYLVNSSCPRSIFSSFYADKSFPWSLWTIKSTGCTDVATVKKILMKWVEFSCNFIFTSDKPWLNKIQLLILLFCLICSFSTLHMKRSIYSSTQSSLLRSAAKRQLTHSLFYDSASYTNLDAHYISVSNRTLTINLNDPSPPSPSRSGFESIFERSRRSKWSFLQ